MRFARFGLSGFLAIAGEVAVATAEGPVAESTGLTPLVDFGAISALLLMPISGCPSWGDEASPWRAPKLRAGRARH